MSEPPRVAFVSDIFYEVNGAALTSREFVEYGKRNGCPVLTLHPHTETRLFDDGSARYVELQRSLATVPVETDFGFDTLMWRYKGLIEKELDRFQPDIMHVVSPGDLGLLSIVIARRRKLPIILGYHTNLHEFARHRLEKALSFLPQRFVESAGKAAEDHSLSLLLQLYKLACASLAPNREYTELLEKASGKRSFVMTRGVDTIQFDPAKRTRTDDTFVIGFVGRLQPEKNVRTLAEVEKILLAEGESNFRFSIVGSGGEQTWLAENMQNLELPGVLRGEALAEAYANMDVFAFTSTTDTFGNVVQEALASGVPAVVTPGGGPKFIIRENETGFIAQDAAGFAQHIRTLMADRARLAAMKRAARAQALEATWDKVFESVYQAYDYCLRDAAC
ncbi:MAG: glycosyltransferase [Bryobacterales bacterium]|nr:glycosyltransferase [Bryobacterales bacterium]